MTKILTYHFQTGTDKNGVKVYDFEAREFGKNPVYVEQGIYQDRAMEISNLIRANPSKFGF